MNKKPIKVGIIWANLDSPNLGVSALAYSSIVIFEEIARRNNLEFEYILWGGKTQERDVLINSKNLHIKECRYFLGGDNLRYLKNFVRRPWTYFDYRHILSLKKCDILVDTGEGDSYADIYGIERFRNFNFIKIVFYKSKIPYILLPQTIGPFKCMEAQIKAKKSLESVSAVIARDQQSFIFCKQLAPNTNLLKSIDMAFFLPYNKMEISGHLNKIKIGINVSGLLWHGGYTGDNQFGLKDNYSQSIILLLDNLMKMEDVDVHLIGHVVSDRVSDDEDSHVLKELIKHYPMFTLAPSFKTPVEAKSYIASMDFFAGARMHACIAAISSCVPVVPMAYSRKFNGLFIETLGYSTMIDLKTDDRKNIIDKFNKALSRRNLLKDEIKHINESVIIPQKNNLINLIESFVVK